MSAHLKNYVLQLKKDVHTTEKVLYSKQGFKSDFWATNIITVIFSVKRN
jgi:hypothetical protein